jgi:UDP-N-acetylglucosamine 4,6-dehydratase
MDNGNGKKQKKELSIKEASLATDIPVHTLRYWEKEFIGFLTPGRTNGGQRRFDESSIKDILKLKDLIYRKGFSIMGAKNALGIKSNEKNHIFKGKTILITGGTGSFGKKFVEIVLQKYKPKKLVILSRDELKQFEMAQQFDDPCIRYFLGDVRDRDRLYRAFYDVDYVIHAAALKQVPAAEYNPFEAVKTNVLGAENVINVSIDQGVKKVIALSTDKAANPVNLYGATKLCSDKLFIGGNSYAGGRVSRFSVVRYGNVIGSRGSVVPFFKKMRKTGVIPITDERMTRFWVTTAQAVEFVMRNFDIMQGGEIFIPKIPSTKITDLAEAIAPECDRKIVGIRPGEKLHEIMVSVDDARNTLEYDDHYLIKPEFSDWGDGNWKGGEKVPEGFKYSSDTNTWWLTIDEIKELIERTEKKRREGEKEEVRVGAGIN